MKANTKICGRCDKHLPLSQYYKQSNTKDKKSNYCKVCKSEYQKERNKRMFKEDPAMYLLRKSCIAAYTRGKPSYRQPGYENVLCSFDNVNTFISELWEDDNFRIEWIAHTSVYLLTNQYRDRPTLDRINPLLGYEKSNIRVLSQSMNVSRDKSKHKISKAI